MSKRSRLYNIYRCMITRCENPKVKDYRFYGGRGITICQEWRESFHAFKEWAINNGYRPDLTIERRDNNGPYSPENCRWATVKEQARNRRTTHLVTYNGVTRSMADLAEEHGIPYGVFALRLRRGWSVERAVKQPLQERRKRCV